MTGAKEPSSEYATLVGSLMAGNTNIDCTRLRMSYVDSPERSTIRMCPLLRRRCSRLWGRKIYATALQNAETVLASEYVNLDAHFAAFIANSEMGAADRAEFHQAVFRGLIDSIRNSGNGKSPEKAWVVISEREEYVLLRVLGFRPSEQSLVQKDGHF